jgi:hypothetical protein
VRGPAVAAGILALMPPGASAAPPGSVGLGVWPARTTVAGGEPQVVHVHNGGIGGVAIDVAPAGFALDLHGAPRIARSRDSAHWLTVRPRALFVAPGATQTFTVWPVVPRGARPGDHPALVILRTRPPGGRAIGVRLRIGVLVDVRVAGNAHRRLALGPPRVSVRGRRRVVSVVVANLGDLTETTVPRFTLQLRAHGRLVARLRAKPRELLPRSRGLVEFVYTGRVHGRLRAVLGVRPLEGGIVTGRRAYWLRL